MQDKSKRNNPIFIFRQSFSLLLALSYCKYHLLHLLEGWFSSRVLCRVENLPFSTKMQNYILSEYNGYTPLPPDPHKSDTGDIVKSWNLNFVKTNETLYDIHGFLWLCPNLQKSMEPRKRFHHKVRTVKRPKFGIGP